MRRSSCHQLTIALAVACFLAAPRDTCGNDGPVEKTDQSVHPKALRVQFDGASWFNFVPAVVAEMAKQTGIEHAGNLDADLGPLATGTIDVYAHGLHWWSHDDVLEKVEQAAVTGLKANPNFRAYCHAAWLPGDGGPGMKTVDDYNNANLEQVQAALDKVRQQVEAKVDQMNQKLGKRVVFVVPVGDATTQLRRMVVAGTFPGVTKQSELWNDAMPHPGPHVRALSGYCHFAAIYRTSPVGLKNEDFRKSGRDSSPITAEQHAILQEIAWNVVSQYPHAGLAASARSGVKASVPDGREKEPKTSVPQPVPRQLKGWKATGESPGDGVVADYNDYIEKLPEAERPGVGDVHYYMDANGHAAVAVLVTVGEKKWMHLLVYDKQGKRTSVQKVAAGK